MSVDRIALGCLGLRIKVTKNKSNAYYAGLEVYITLSNMKKKSL